MQKALPIQSEPFTELLDLMGPYARKLRRSLEPHAIFSNGQSQWIYKSRGGGDLQREVYSVFASDHVARLRDAFSSAGAPFFIPVTACNRLQATAFRDIQYAFRLLMGRTPRQVSKQSLGLVLRDLPEPMAKLMLRVDRYACARGYVRKSVTDGLVGMAASYPSIDAFFADFMARWDENPTLVAAMLCSGRLTIVPGKGLARSVRMPSSV
jgi:hypothetical protein